MLQKQRRQLVSAADNNCSQRGTESIPYPGNQKFHAVETSSLRHLSNNIFYFATLLFSGKTTTGLKVLASSKSIIA